jgi:PAS domain S-box-containing protein
MALSTRPPKELANPLGAADLARRVIELEQELATLRASQEQWRRREEELSDFVENAVVGLHRVGPDGTILWANAADHELLGYSADEYIGHNIAEFHADRETLCTILENLVEGRTLHDQPAALKCKDGSVRHVVISSNAHFENGRFVNTRCFTRDVTQQRLVEAALRETRMNLAAIVESSDDAIIGLDLQGRVNSWNSGAERMYGYPRDEIVGRPIMLVIPEELYFEETEIFDRVRSGQPVRHYETVRMRKDGSRIDVSLTVSAVRDAQGRLVGVSKVARDISERKAAEREAAEAARRKDEFLAILAHELRNPLAPIRYALDIARQANASPEHRQRAEEIITRQVDQMARLLDDLLDVSRIARGQVTLRRKWVDLTSVVGCAIDAARPLLDVKAHRLSIDLPRETLRLNADPVRLTQILTNLLTNAAKYTDREGDIQLCARREGDEVVVSVRDNGIGIAPEMMPRMFTLFAQASPALQRSEGGLGVGLALVKGFVEMHGGRIEARSEGAGRGSEFTVRMPIGEKPREDGAEAAAEPSRKRSLRVLVADDNVDIAETSATLLELWGHEVRVAQSGREALEVAEKFRPQLALVDIGMPQMSGLDVARALRRTPWGASMRLVAVTGWGQEEDRKAALGSGFDDHITKPVEPARLQAVFEAVFEQAGALDR